MEDERIIELFFQRNEDAVTEAQHKYKTYCAHIALNLISNSQDAEECVNDVFLTAWKRIPPEQPRNLKTWLGKVTHDSAVNLWKKNHRQKRYAGITQALDELQEAVPDFRNPEQEKRFCTCYSAKNVSASPQPQGIFRKGGVFPWVKSTKK